MSVMVALVMGLVGSLHCVGMCGGLQAILCMPKPEQSAWQYYGSLCLLNVGRITLYASAGAAFAWLGTRIGAQFTSLDGSMLLRQMTGVITVLIGLQLLLPAFRPFGALEKAGYRVWQRVRPWLSRLPSRSPSGMLLRGALWGFLPCGLVYSALAVAAVSGSFMSGGLTMLAFGLGTLPAMLASGFIWNSIKKITQTWFVKGVGVFLVIVGLVVLVPTLMPHDVHHAGHSKHNVHTQHEHHTD